jgi:hypothetical protein
MSLVPLIGKGDCFSLVFFYDDTTFLSFCQEGWFNNGTVNEKMLDNTDQNALSW